MPRLLALLLALSLALTAACGETAVDEAPPTDQFTAPTGLALAPRPAGGPALLVGSSNFDLRYQATSGGTVLSVDPRPAPEGSAGAAGGALVRLGTGARVGSYGGPLAYVGAENCPGLAQPVALVASRYTRKLHRLPVGADGAVDACSGPACELDLDPDLSDPFVVKPGCRSDGLRRSAFVGYLRSPTIDLFGAGTGWISEIDLDDPQAAPRTFALGPGPVGDLAYDAQTDRLYAVGRFAGLAAPLFILDLPPCRSSDAACRDPRLQTVDLYPAARGAEPVSIALSNPQAGRSRRAYVLARLYDADLAASIGARPGFDTGAALLVVDLGENALGLPSARVRHVEPFAGVGPGEVRVLPTRPGLADVVVLTSPAAGTVMIYDDEVSRVVRAVAIDPASGIPLTGRGSFATAVEDRGATARVYVAAFVDWTVSLIDVPLATPGQAALVTDAAGAPVRIGKEKP